MKRREFLQHTAATVAAASTPAFAAAAAPRKVLVLGGTDYLGPVIVEELVARGHEVTLFNRGRTNPHLFPELRKLRGDRELEDGRGLEALRKSKDQWDWVVDTWQGSPKCVLDSARLLQGRVGQYQYVSSVAVYEDWNEIGADEDSALNTMPPMPERVAEEFRYGLRKSMGEVAVRGVMGSDYATFRSHGMRGAPVITGESEPYWPVRISRSGDVVVPRDATWTQMTDLVSLVRFMAHCGEQGVNGPFNVAYRPMQFREYIANIVAATESDARLHWLPQDFLAQHDVLPYRDIPMWRDRPAGAYRFDVSRALQAGLVNRPHGELVMDQLRGYRERNPDNDYEFTIAGTLSAEREAELLRAWKAG